jgi:hypothetical protein
VVPSSYTNKIRDGVVSGSNTKTNKQEKNTMSITEALKTIADSFDLERNEVRELNQAYFDAASPEAGTQYKAFLASLKLPADFAAYRMTTYDTTTNIVFKPVACLNHNGQVVLVLPNGLTITPPIEGLTLNRQESTYEFKIDDDYYSAPITARLAEGVQTTSKSQYKKDLVAGGASDPKPFTGDLVDSTMIKMGTEEEPYYSIIIFVKDGDKHRQYKITKDPEVYTRISDVGKVGAKVSYKDQTLTIGDHSIFLGRATNIERLEPGTYEIKEVEAIKRTSKAGRPFTMVRLTLKDGRKVEAYNLTSMLYPHQNGRTVTISYSEDKTTPNPDWMPDYTAKATTDASAPWATTGCYVADKFIPKFSRKVNYKVRNNLTASKFAALNLKPLEV